MYLNSKGNAVIVVDAHQDIAYNAVCFNRDYFKAALRKRQLEQGTHTLRDAGEAVTGLPESIAGRVAVVFATIFVAPYSRQTAPWQKVMYRNADEAHKLGQAQLDYYHRLDDTGDMFNIIHTQADLARTLATWESGKSLRDREQGAVLLMENADPIREPKALEYWVERGLRIVGPAWQASRYSAGTGQPGTLTDLGRELLEQMMGFNLILDLSHMAEAAYLEALDRYEGPVIASHSNPRRFNDTDRHLSDEMILKLAERDGVMGIVLYNRFLDRAWSKVDGKGKITLDTVTAAIDHVCQLTGNAAHVGIGSDFDGGFGAESVPKEIDTVADLWHIGGALRQRGYSEADVEAVMGGNMLRKLREGLPA